MQHRASIAVIECKPLDEVIWQQRLEGRAALDTAGNSSHKPRTWEQLKKLIAGCAEACAAAHPPAASISQLHAQVAAALVLCLLWRARGAWICRYEGTDQWTNDGSAKVQHLLLLDTGQGSLQEQADQVLRFLSRQGLIS